MPTINMRSMANSVKGQGVGSCYDEQVKLVKTGLFPRFEVFENKKGHFDIIHYHTVNPTYYLERLFKKRKSAAVGYVHFLPATVDNSLKLPKIARVIFYKYILSFYGSMDYLVTVNPDIVSKIAEAGITGPEVRFIPNYVSSDSFHEKSRDDVKKIRESYGIPEDKFVALGVGQLQTRKGVRDFVKTAELMPEMLFVWAGGFSFGKITDGYDEIKAMTENPPKNVKFIGIVDRELMPDIYNMSDVLFLPSFDELFPMTILEAICCKKPLLLRDIDIYHNILFDYYLKASDVEGFAEMLQRLSADGAFYDEWCENSWKCHLRYSEESILKMWEELYTEACGSVKGSRGHKADAAGNRGL